MPKLLVRFATRDGGLLLPEDGVVRWFKTPNGYKFAAKTHRLACGMKAAFLHPFFLNLHHIWDIEYMYKQKGVSSYGQTKIRQRAN